MAIAVDRTVVDKFVFATFLFDETETFFIVKLLDLNKY
jgi:hypothetical protein